jgi:hypothetical protein
VAPYLALCRKDAEQREYAFRDVFNAMGYVVDRFVLLPRRWVKNPTSVGAWLDGESLQ